MYVDFVRLTAESRSHSFPPLITLALLYMIGGVEGEQHRCPGRSAAPARCKWQPAARATLWASQVAGDNVLGKHIRNRLCESIVLLNYRIASLLILDNRLLFKW